VAKIFISYRRDDSGGWAGRLYDRLSQHFGRDNVFMDINTIEPVLDFVEVIEQAVGQCDALIALIGKQWLTLTDDAGRWQLDNPGDFVRLEIAAALARNIRVIPVLVEGALMPRSTDLPDALKLLARRNAHEISDRRFRYDVDRLIEVLDNVLASTKTATALRSDATIAPAPPPSHVGDADTAGNVSDSHAGNAGIAGRPDPASRMTLTARQSKTRRGQSLWVAGHSRERVGVDT
jgi:hypothetical protein